MATQLGLRDIVHGDNDTQRFTVPPRMLPPPTSSIEREERVRAYWMTEALDGYSTLRAAWNVHILRPPLTKVLPCNTEEWECTEPIVDFLAFGDFESPSSFALYVSFVTNELFEMHQFLQQSFQTTTPEDRNYPDEDLKLARETTVERRKRSATYLTAFWKRIEVIPAVAIQMVFHEVVRRRGLHVSEKDWTTLLGRYSTLDCIQGEIDVWPSGRVEAVTYSIVCVGVRYDGPGPVVF